MTAKTATQVAVFFSDNLYAKNIFTLRINF